MVKKNKKADTFGDRGSWQIDKNVRMEVMDYMTFYNNYEIFEDTLDDVILALHALGYIELDEANG